MFDCVRNSNCSEYEDHDERDVALLIHAGNLLYSGLGDARRGT
jgi:hypothetical protein